MAEHRLSHDDLEQMDDVPRWVDAHSVTCPICGDLADEREATRITTDEMELGGAMQAENPDRFDVIRAAADEFGEGEAHEQCLQRYMAEDDQ